MVNSLSEHIQVIKDLENELSKINDITKIICRALKQGNSVYIFGNGGSAVDAEHFVAELVNRFEMERRPLSAFALSSNNAIITAIGNDYNFEDIYSKQVDAYVKRGDIVIGLSTSGTSKNVLKGLEKAKIMGAIPVLISGNSTTSNFLTITIPSSHTPRIQEAYILVLHIIAEFIERGLFGE